MSQDETSATGWSGKTLSLSAEECSCPKMVLAILDGTDEQLQKALAATGPFAGNLVITRTPAKVLIDHANRTVLISFMKTE